MRTINNKRRLIIRIINNERHLTIRTINNKRHSIICIRFIDIQLRAKIIFLIF